MRTPQNASKTAVKFHVACYPYSRSNKLQHYGRSSDSFPADAFPPRLTRAVAKIVRQKQNSQQRVLSAVCTLFPFHFIAENRSGSKYIKKRQPFPEVRAQYIASSVNTEPLFRIFAGVMDNEDLAGYLEQFLSEKRLLRFREVLSQRTSHMRVVLEDIYQAHNASAVLRSCDCFGVQHVHFIENGNSMRVNDEVAMGSSAWLNIHRHNKKGVNNTSDTLRMLKEDGYRIVVTSPHRQGFTPGDLPVEEKFALVFGTEMHGVSAEVMDAADAFVSLPMYGFTESFNISVCAALCMYDLTRRIRETVPQWQLNEAVREEVYFTWLKASIDKSDAIIARYLKEKKV